MSDLDTAKRLYHTHSYTFVIVQADRVVAFGTRDGVGELLDVVAEAGEILKGAALADKIVGKAVAMVAAHAGITAVYSPLMSEPAVHALQVRGIEAASDRIVPFIQNKRGDGLCPMEQLTLPFSEPAAAVRALATFLAQRKPPTAAQSASAFLDGNLPV